MVGTMAAIFTLPCKGTKFEGLSVHVSKTGHTEEYSRAPLPQTIAGNTKSVSPVLRQHLKRC